MIEKKTSVDLIESSSNGDIRVRMTLNLCEGGAVLSTQYHRTMIPSDLNHDLQMAAVNQHLLEMGWPQVSADAVARIGAFQALARTTA